MESVLPFTGRSNAISFMGVITVNVMRNVKIQHSISTFFLRTALQKFKSVEESTFKSDVQ